MKEVEGKHCLELYLTKADMNTEIWGLDHCHTEQNPYNIIVGFCKTSLGIVSGF